MATNLTKLHKQLAALQSKLESLDKRIAEQGETTKDTRQETRLMARQLNILAQISTAIQQSVTDNGRLIQVQLDVTRGTAERLMQTEH